MAYDTNLAARIRVVLKGKTDIVEKEMFGGLAPREWQHGRRDRVRRGVDYALSLPAMKAKAKTAKKSNPKGRNAR